MRIALIGYGEVGSIFARDLAAAGEPDLVAFDSVPEKLVGVPPSLSATSAVTGADLVFVAVTAGSTLAAMESIAPGLGHGPLVVDVNSVSPATKQAAAKLIEHAGGRYVEAAVMSSVPPHGIRSPMLLGGPHAGLFMAMVQHLDMRLTAFSPEIGPASSVKMCRSVMIKGLEALATECFLTARHYGVEDHVLASLGDTLPHEDWPKLARYVISRALLHGRRRAEEMREVARTVADAGVEPLLSLPIAARQEWAYAKGQAIGRAAIAEDDLGTLLDAIAQAR
jgi:3-hydroxyisobutyrate dehydrogenase